MPLFMPENGDSDQLIRHHHGLVDQTLAVLLHLVQDLVGGVPPGCSVGLAGHSQRIDESLAMIDITVPKVEKLHKILWGQRISFKKSEI